MEEKKQEHTKVKKDYWKNYNSSRYHARKAAGICTACGKEPAQPGHTRCAACAEANRLQNQRSAAKVNVKRSGEFEIPKKWPFGYCCVCGEPTDPEWKLCEKHRHLCEAKA